MKVAFVISAKRFWCSFQESRERHFSPVCLCLMMTSYRDNLPKTTLQGGRSVRKRTPAFEGVFWGARSDGSDLFFRDSPAPGLPLPVRIQLVGSCVCTYSRDRRRTRTYFRLLIHRKSWPKTSYLWARAWKDSLRKKNNCSYCGWGVYKAFYHSIKAT